MAEKEQIKPLATTVVSPLNIDHEKDLVVENRSGRRKTLVTCCGCVAAITVISAVVMIILAFTVLHVRGPIVKVDSVTNLGAQNNSLTLLAHMSVKNPNAMAYRYDNSTTTVFYGGTSVGKGEIPAGLARARRTVLTNLTVAISMSNVFNSSRFNDDFTAGSLTMESFTRLEGRVKIANIVTKKVVVQLNCTMVYGIFTQNIEKQDCEDEIFL